MISEKEHLKQQNMIRFIEAAQELIDTEGLKKVSIRKIADKAGFHNSTIYLYFRDVDQLILLASLKHFTEYSKALSELSTKNLSASETFLYIWEFFADTIFNEPEIFFNFFYGKHSDDLSSIMRQYYELFPNEKSSYSKGIEEMYYGKNIHERCMKILLPIVSENNHLTDDNLDMVNDIIVSYLKALLEQKCQNPELNSDMLKKKLLRAIRYIVGCDL